MARSLTVPPQLYPPVSVQEGKESELTYVVYFLPVARGLITILYPPDSEQEGKEIELIYVVSFLPVARSLTTTVIPTVLCTG